jgi:uncharacterized protein (DUF2141 family)
MKIALLTLILSFFFQFVMAQGHGTIIVEIDQIENPGGDIKAGLYQSADGFPDDVSKAYKVSSAKIVDGKSVLVFKDVKFGSYVLAAFHDENSNKQLDKTSKGVPIEPLALSNNLKLKLGPPKFEAALFEFNSVEMTMALKLQRYRTKSDSGTIGE